MAERFVGIDRDTPLLLPPDMRDWLPEDDMVHFVIEAANRVEMNAFRVNTRGCGSRQYPPRMMLALLVYCYSQGIFGSRRIERATYRDVGVRVLTADTHPDHDTICKFRRENRKAFSAAFLQVLQMASEIGVLKVGDISVDGTHIRANASKDQNITYRRACELSQQLEGDIAGLIEQAEAADAKEREQAPDKLPGEIARREKLREKMDKAKERIEQQAKARAERERVEYERKVKEREKRKGSRKGPRPKEPDETPRGNEQTNLSDPESKLMRKSKREAYTQSYNAQASVDADGSQLILGCHLTDNASDANELEPALELVTANAGKPKRLLADSGYINSAAIGNIENQGVEAYVAVGRNNGNYERRYDYRPESCRNKPGKKLTDERLIAMRDKLDSEEGRRIYSKRQRTVEPVFGIIKRVMGFRQFSLTGKAKVSLEWGLVCLGYNLKRLWMLKSELETA